MYIDGLLYDLKPRILLIIIAIILLILRQIFLKKLDDKIKKQSLAIIILGFLFGVYATTTVAISIVSPDYETYSGEYVAWHRDSRASYPFGLSNSYQFTDGETTRSFNIDAQSKKTVYPREFIVGEEYIIYYKEGFTRDIIVKVEEVE